MGNSQPVTVIITGDEVLIILYCCCYFFPVFFFYSQFSICLDLCNFIAIVKFHKLLYSTMDLNSFGAEQTQKKQMKNHYYENGWREVCVGSGWSSCLVAYLKPFISTRRVVNLLCFSDSIHSNGIKYVCFSAAHQRIGTLVLILVVNRRFAAHKHYIHARRGSHRSSRHLVFGPSAAVAAVAMVCHLSSGKYQNGVVCAICM